MAYATVSKTVDCGFDSHHLSRETATAVSWEWQSKRTEFARSEDCTLVRLAPQSLAAQTGGRVRYPIIGSRTALGGKRQSTLPHGRCAHGAQLAC